MGVINLKADDDVTDLVSARCCQSKCRAVQDLALIILLFALSLHLEHRQSDRAWARQGKAGR